MQPQRGGTGISPTHSPSDTKGGEWSAPRSGRFAVRKDLVTTAQEAGWASGSVRTARKFSPHRVSFPEPPVSYRVAIPTNLSQIPNITVKM